MTRRVLAAISAWTIVVVASAAVPAAAASPEPIGGVQVPAGEGDTELPPDAGRIIGSPDAGPDPEHSGDRGGWAQLTLLGALVAGVGFIMWRILSSVRDRPAAD